MLLKRLPTLPRVAYFSMEYGLHEEFRIYAGGLGILAGDYLKAAKDQNVPLVGIGLLWREGYTTQLIGDDGTPYDTYPDIKYDFLEDTGISIVVNIRGNDVKAKVWKVTKYDNAPLYLLDTNLAENKERWITKRLYGGYSEDRIAQEILLGIGGIRLLRKLGIEIDVYHFNEGHAILAGIELIKEKMAEGLSFEEAWNTVKKDIVFTTHTPIKAGNEEHDINTLCCMGAFNGLTHDQMLSIGGNPFNMTVAGLRLSKIANGVSELHGNTARKMWKHIMCTTPIISVTNGVHRFTWQDRSISKAFEEKTDLWKPHQNAKRTLIAEVKKQNGVKLDENALLIGFARRSVPYKRPDLIFKDIDKIESLLRDGKLQMIFSGKAHPMDNMGKSLITKLVNYSKCFPNQVVFLENYDMKIGKLLTRGCDIWLNTPKRPLEASGTSGMKAAMNGCLNLSVLDGWWPEGCINGVNGWQIGDGYEGDNQDNIDMHSLYSVLFKQVIPTYYDNREKWVEMMRASIEMSHYNFSSKRMLNEYFELCYIPKVFESKKTQAK